MPSTDVRALKALVWPVLGVVALISYNTWVFWQPVNGHSRIFDGYLSELSASDQPNNLFFRAGDLITSLIVGTLGVRAVVVWRLHERRRWWLVAAAALLLFAVATFFDAFFAMDCSPTLNETCRILEEHGRLSAVHYAHTFTSVGAQVGIVASMIAALLGCRVSYPGTRRARLLLAACVAEVTALTVMLVLIAADVPALGYPQVVLVTVASVWFAAVGFGVLGAPAAAARAAPAQLDESVRAVPRG